MIKIKQAVIVEGKYDKIKLQSIIDAVIIPTDGFRIFKDRDTLALLRSLAEKCGVLILTDSDSAGFMIRKYLTAAITKGEIYNAFIPDIFGKERRKTTPSSEGKLGVEGVPNEVIIEALEKAGVTGAKREETGEKRITKTDLFNDGLSGGKDSKKRRTELLALLDLPERMTTNTLLEVLNVYMGFDEYKENIEKIKG